MSKDIVELNDREVAVLIDSLAMVRDQLREQGYTGNDNQSALDKINSLMTPSTYGLLITTSTKPTNKPTIGLMARDHDVMQGTFYNLEEARKALRERGSDGWTLVNIIEGDPQEGYIIEMFRGEA